MAKIKFFIRTSNKTDLTNIYVRFYNSRSFDLTARACKQIKPDYWNNKQGNVRQRAEFAESESLQRDLDKLKTHILDEYNKTPNKAKDNKGWLKTIIDKYYSPEKYLQGNTTLFGYIQHFIDNSKTRINTKTGNPVCYKMRREYSATFNYLKEYAQKYNEPDFIDIDLEFHQQFVDFLRTKGLATNTIGKKIQTLKIFLNAAYEKGINPYQKYNSKKFVALSEETDNIYLTKKELQQFYEYDFSNKPKLERVRDLFIIGCWTGLRFADQQQITDKINGDFIELRQKKTGSKVVIPIHSMVKEILKKYNGVLPKPISNQKYNEYLKEAAKEAGLNKSFTKTVITNGLKHEKKIPKYELISSHTARRSFCTNAYKDDIPTIAIMAVSGHKTEQAFLKYIKADPMEHAKKVMEIWQKNGEFLKVVNE